MAESPVYDPAVIDDDVAPFGKALDGHERAVRQAMLAVLCFAACRYVDSVAYTQCKLHWPIDLEAIGLVDRWRFALTDDEARTFLEAPGILLELHQVARLVFRGVGFLGIGQVGGNPDHDHALVGKRALCL